MAELKSKGKRKAVEMELDDETGEVEIQAPAQKKKNRQRVLLLSSRGVTHRMRHLMNDLEVLLPHVKKGMCPVIIFPDFLLNLIFRFETGLQITAKPTPGTRGSE